MTAYGYARVSSEGQRLDAQREALAAAGATEVFAEKLSGASAANRKELAKVLAKLEPGDVLLVTRLDRLARSTRDLLNVIANPIKSSSKQLFAHTGGYPNSQMITFLRSKSWRATLRFILKFFARR